MNYYQPIVDSSFLIGNMSKVRFMKDWVYFISCTQLSIEPFYKEIGWSLGLKNNFIF